MCPFRANLKQGWFDFTVISQVVDPGSLVQLQAWQRWDQAENLFEPIAEIDSVLGQGDRIAYGRTIN